MATGSCGLPTHSVVNCANTQYGSGIEYIAGKAINDLSVNVGTPAGQGSAVVVTGGIVIGSPPFSYTSISETLNVGGNVSIAASGDGELVNAASFVYSATNAGASSAANIANAGRVTTQGSYHNGVQALAISYADALSYSGSASAKAVSSIQNIGPIDVAGYGAKGIVSSSYAVAGKISDPIDSNSMATTVVQNSGSITTSGAGGIYGHPLGIDAIAYSYVSGVTNGHASGAAVVDNSGAITTSGDFGDGIGATTVSAALDLYRSHSIAVTSVANTGEIATSGANTTGINAIAYALAGSVANNSHSLATADAQSNIVNEGSIDAKNANSVYADGIYSLGKAVSSGIGGATASASSNITNGAAIRVVGGFAIGIYSAAFSYARSYHDANSTAAASVHNTGSITVTSRKPVEGIVATAFAVGKSRYSDVNLVSSVAVQNSGTIAVSGGPFSIGILAEARTGNEGGSGYGQSSVTITNSANISASGNGAAGIIAIADTETITNSAGAIMGGSGTYAKGIYAGGLTSVVNNGGSVGSANDRAIELYSFNSSTLNNTGTITGTVTMRATTNIFNNAGLWVVRGMNSSFYTGPGGSSIVVNTGRMTIVGDQTLENLNILTNAGSIDMTQAASSGLGLRPAVEMLEVSGDYVGVGGTLAVDANPTGAVADVLKIDGSASGGTHVAATIVGAPVRTIGNGILVVEAGSGAAANEFTLTGNSSGHTEVAGAFEYNLDFLPGAETSGGWYLRSHIYPGTYQFGQIGSSALIVSEHVNIDVSDLLGQMKSTATGSASLDGPAQGASADTGLVSQPGRGSLAGWGRYDESQFSVSPSGSASADYKLRVDTAQFGLGDTWHNADNIVVFGGYMAPFHAWANFTKFGHTEIGSSGDAYALYGLWFSGPWQAGLRLNYENDTAHFSDGYIGTNASLKTPEEGVQGVASYSMQFDWANIDPSLELNYGKARSGSIVDGANDTVRIGDTSDLWSKLNARFSWDVDIGHNLLVQPYINLGLLYRGNMSTTVDIDSFELSTNVNGLAGDIALGDNISLAAHLAMFAQVDYLAGNRIRGVTGFLGLHYTP